MPDLALAVLAVVTLLVAFIAGVFLASKVTARAVGQERNAVDRIQAITEVFRTWGEHIENDAHLAKERGGEAIAAVETRIAAREKAFQAWVATL